MRILVIEDELQLAGHITRALVRRGHLASAQHDGALGLQAALTDPPDLVVLDLGLPGLDGLGVLAKLRQAQSLARILILTARGEVEHRVKGLKAGADDYLAKPFAMEDLIARVEALGRRGGPAGEGHGQGKKGRCNPLQMSVHGRLPDVKRESGPHGSSRQPGPPWEGAGVTQAGGAGARG